MNRLSAVVQALAMVVTAWFFVGVWSLYVFWLAVRWGTLDRTVISPLEVSVTTPKKISGRPA
jgi:hypothetical protein